MGKLLRELELMEPLRSRILAGTGVRHLCRSYPVQNSLREARRHILPPWISALCGTLYGRQLGSFAAEQEFGDFWTNPHDLYPCAPIFPPSPGKTEVLARVDGRIVAAREDRQLVTALPSGADGGFDGAPLFFSTSSLLPNGGTNRRVNTPRFL